MMMAGRGRGRGRGRDLSSMNGDLERQAIYNHAKRMSAMEKDFVPIPSRPPYAVSKENGGLVSGKKVKASPPPGPNDQVVNGKKVELTSKVEGIQDVTRMMVVRKRFPNEFYMIRESDNFEFSKNKRVAAEFQDVMNKAERAADVYIVKPELQMCYAYQEPRTRTWARVRLLKVMEAKSMEIAMVYDIDNEFKELVPLRGLRQLPEKWLHPVVPVFRCHLYDVIPIEGGGDYHWSEEATAFFDATVREKMRYLVLPMNFSAAKVHDSLVDTKYDVGVLIFFPSLKTRPLRCVNYEMTTKGYGLAVGPGASHVNMLYLPKRLPEYKRQINGGPDTSSSFVNMNIISQQLSRNHLSQIKICHVVDPSCLYVQMSAKLGEFRAMEEDLGTVVKDLKAIPQSDFKVGLSVACPLMGYGHAEVKWNRAVIYDNAVCAKCIKVILVDYGDVIAVSVGRVYPLPDQFQSIHSFAIRLHLNEICPADVRDKTTATNRKPPLVWSEKIRSAFDSLTCALEMDNPVYHAFQPSFSDVIKLKNIRQKLEFDMEQLIWKACETRAMEQGEMDETHERIVRENSLLTSHFYSSGVDIVYEGDESQGLFTKQEYLTDLLLECGRGGVRLIKPRIDREKYFTKLVELYESPGM